MLVALSVTAACSDDFLEKYPEGSLSEEAFFNTATDLKTYINGCYENFPRYHIWYTTTNSRLDAKSDIMIVTTDITGALNQSSNSGIASIESNDWNNGYKYVRQVNYFLNNLNKVKRAKDVNHYIGEGYFFRAWYYFSLYKKFGDIPYITKSLNVSDTEELYRPRDSRNIVAKKMIQDLDSAIVNLDWKGEGEARAGRINKEAAIVMKSRVALYEGTWEKYHAANGTKFNVEGKNGDEFLTMIEPAMNKLIEKRGGEIFNTGAEPYNQLHSQYNMENVDGAYLYVAYDSELLDRSHNFYSLVSLYRGESITKRFVDLFLDKAGVPQSTSELPLTNMAEMGQNLDPRFRQTVWTPDRGPQSDIPGRSIDGHLRYPPIPVTVKDRNSTGYARWKGAILDESQKESGDTDDLLIRYAEGLLALAEAKAILGTISQSDLDKTVNVLRGRVGMAPMVLNDVNGWAIDYDAKAGFDPASSNIVNEIRRERTIELSFEGFRVDDLKRWAAYHTAINGYKPKGARMQEFLDYFDDKDRLEADGFDLLGYDNVKLKKGTSVDADDDGFINPYFRSTQFQSDGDGFYIDPGRDYLLSIPTAQIEIYEQNGFVLTQNPGWN